MLDDIIELIIEFVLELVTELLFEKKMPFVLRVIFGVLIGAGGLALGSILLAMGISGQKNWMTIIGAIVLLLEIVIVIGGVRRHRKEKDILY